MAEHARLRHLHPRRLSSFLPVIRDDLLARLGPATVLEALAAPAGALSACLDTAPPSDRDLAVRAAVISRRVWEWLTELDGWTWSGFAAGPSDVDDACYAARIDEVGREMGRLDVEDIKKNVLQNHLRPLSRPTTPATDSDGLSLLSLSSAASSYYRMDDLTAVITTIVMQALPNLARLSALLRLWTLRLRVLQNVPLFLSALDDAETGLASAWAQSDGRGLQATARALAADVAEPARLLDYMLDCLEGLPDTLPDVWIDRVEALERDHAEWLGVCERTLQDERLSTASAVKAEQYSAADDSAIVASPGALDGTMAVNWPDEVWRGKAEDDSPPSTPPHDEVPRCYDGGDDDDVDDDVCTPPSPQSRLPTATGRGNTTSGDALSTCDDSLLSGQVMSPIKEDGDDDDDVSGLPRLRTAISRQSLNSQASTLIFSGLGHSSSPPDMSTSPAARLRHTAAESPLQSPLRRSKTASATMGQTEDALFLKSPADESFAQDFDDTMSMMDGPSYTLRGEGGAGDDQLQQQISDIIDSIPARIKLASSPTLNPPDVRLRKPGSRDSGLLRRSASSLSSRAGTPSFTLSPAKHCRPRHRRAHQEIQVYHLSRSTGEAPIKLFIRCVGEHGERVMVRVGGGWADLGEYLKAYASHHGRRSHGVEIRSGRLTPVAPVSDSSPTTRPGSAADIHDMVSPATPIQMRKLRASELPSSSNSRPLPRTPSSLPSIITTITTKSTEPPSSDSAQSRSSSRISWVDDDGDGASYLGLAGPSGRRVKMTDENRAWVESVKEKVRIASGSAGGLPSSSSRFGDLGAVGGTRRLFPAGTGRRR
ncbi:hypothetical protein CDD80_6601 [Ophiocordyceps camponoti-rufipedis]|uniref:GAR domain-containing protein n=1 Tax=Ophiocordyceps camponoti-rufipedis TaxID=2004952 RepID=A0A2C5YQP2_9HYPO|nr:hypothetical protein CDD80_6601 [Ophiocordyceps camponoti-rufipedis]